MADKTAPKPITIKPITVKAARKLVRARGLGRVPQGHIVAVSAGSTSIYASGGPSDLDPSSFSVQVYASDCTVDGAQRAVMAVAQASLEMGYLRAAVRMPVSFVPTVLKRSGWLKVHEDAAGHWWGIASRKTIGEMRVVPLGQAAANDWVHRTHSHLPASRGSMFSVGIEDSAGELHCVAQVGVVRARMLMVSGDVAEVVRVASDRTKNVASMALGAVVRACLSLGYTRVVSYTILGESGHSYRVSGWRPTSVSGGGEWSRASRARTKAAQPQRKVRWEIGPGAKLVSQEREDEILAAVADAVGKVDFQPRAGR